MAGYGKDGTVLNATHPQVIDPTLSCLSKNGARQGKAWSQANGLMSSIIEIGAAIAALFFAPVVADKYGRRAALLIGCAIAIVGSVVQVFSVTVAVMIVGRFVLGLGVGHITYGLSMYLSEISPKKVRGTMTGLMQVFCG